MILKEYMGLSVGAMLGARFMFKVKFRDMIEYAINKHMA